MTESVSAVMLSARLGNGTKNYQIPNRAKNRAGPEDKIEELSEESVDRAMQALKEYIDSHERSLDISVYKATGDIIVKVISEKDGKVIREIPPEELLDCAAKMEQLAGLLFDEMY